MRARRARWKPNLLVCAEAHIAWGNYARRRLSFVTGSRGWSHRARNATALGLTFVMPTLSYALPPPDVDRLGDDVRMPEWERPFPIPGLSRYARAIIGASRAGRVPAVALQKAYAERDCFAGLIRPRVRTLHRQRSARPTLG